MARRIEIRYLDGVNAVHEDGIGAEGPDGNGVDHGEVRHAAEYVQAQRDRLQNAAHHGQLHSTLHRDPSMMQI